MIYPPRLKQGDTIRVIAQSASLAIPQAWNTEELRNTSLNNLNKLGFKVGFGKNVNISDEFHSSSIEERIKDLHDAFYDNEVSMILCAIGGFNANQLLKYIDFDLIKSNPKIFCGYSDITVLGNAIYSMTGVVTYSGPHYTTFGYSHENEYTIEYFMKCITTSSSFEIKPSKKWHDFKNFHDNDGYWIINEGVAEGRILGGNLSTFNELHGTEYMPVLDNSILFLEDDSLVNARIFERDLQSLIHQPGFEKIEGIVIGRFQPESKVTKEQLVKVIKTKKELDNISVIANADFGHTKPLFTFPIGGQAKIRADKNNSAIEISEH